MSFLSLPLECRTPIYKELLAPFKADPVLIFHDREDRSGSLGIYPEILRTCRQIYIEAVPCLYNSDIHFEISLATDQKKAASHGEPSETRPYPDGRPWPRPFFKAPTLEEAEGIIAELEFGIKDVVLCFQETATFRARNYGDVDLGPTFHGFIHPHILRRIRHLDIALSYDAVWQRGRGRIYLSSVGELLTCIFKVLGVNLETEPAIRTLTVVTPMEDPREPDPIRVMLYNSRITGYNGKSLWEGNESLMPCEIAMIFDTQRAFRTLEKVRKVERWACLTEASIREASKPEDGGFQQRHIKRETNRIWRGW